MQQTYNETPNKIQKVSDANEINIHALVNILLQHKQKLFYVTLACAALALIYITTVPQLYLVSIKITAVSERDFAEINENQYIEVTPVEAVTAFKLSFNDYTLQKHFFDDSTLFETHFPSLDSSDKQIIFDEFFSNLKTRTAQNNPTERISIVEVTGKHPEFLTDTINHLAKKTNEHILTELSSQAAEVQLIKIKQLETRIASRINTHTKMRQDEIARIEEQSNTEKAKILTTIDALLLEEKEHREARISQIRADYAVQIAKINNQIEALRKQQKELEHAKIKQLEEDAKIASELGFYDYYDFDKSAPTSSPVTQDGSVTIFNEKTSSQRPSFSSGEKLLSVKKNLLNSRTNPDLYNEKIITLKAELQQQQANMQSEIDTLKSRASDEHFIPELAELNKKLYELDNNHVSQILKQRSDDRPFVPGLRELEEELAIAASVDSDFTTLSKAIHIVKPATLPAKKVQNDSVKTFFAFILAGFFTVALTILLKEGYLSQKVRAEEDIGKDETPANTLKRAA